MGQPRVVVTVDVEDWPQSTRDHSLNITSRAVVNTENLLEILAAYRFTVTMFVWANLRRHFQGA